MRHKNLLTLLGCSLPLVLSAPAHSRELVFTASSEPLPEEMSEFDCGCSPDSEAARLLDLEGERAIATFGCDCAGCRYMTRPASLSANQP